MYRIEKWWNFEIKTVIRGNKLIPFVFIISGLIFLLYTPVDARRMNTYSGYLSKYDKNNYSTFCIKGNKIKFKVQTKKDKELLRAVFPTAKHIEVWSRKILLGKNKDFIMQLKVDGRMVIEYNWWYHAKVPIFFIVIGLILLPIVRKEWGKMKKEGEI